MRLRRNFPIITPGAILAVCLSIMCTQESNPYLKPQRGALVFTRMPVLQGDTVKIFSTFSFSFDITAADDIGSIDLRCAGNRLWHNGDTLFSGEALSRAPFTLFASIRDTGLQTLTAIVNHRNGEADSQTISFTAISPLNQRAIAVSIGDTVTLSSDPVADDVIYVWTFPNHTSEKNNTSYAQLIVGGDFTFGFGNLYVKDGADVSPSQQYQISRKVTVSFP